MSNLSPEHLAALKAALSSAHAALKRNDTDGALGAVEHGQQVVVAAEDGKPPPDPPPVLKIQP